MKRERQRHVDAFEIWYATDRSRHTVAERLSVSEAAVAKWIGAFGWHARADARDREAAKKAEREAINRRAKVLEEQRKAGELMRRRGTEHLVKHEIKETRDALTAITKGVELERQAENMPAHLLEVLNYSEAELRAEWERISRAAAEGADRPAPGAQDGEAGGDPEDDPGFVVLSPDADPEAGDLPGPDL